MKAIRQSLKKRFGTPEKKPRLRVICATIGPGKARLLELIAKTRSISEAAREMKMSYKRAWELIDAMNACFRKPLVASMTGGSRGGGSRLTPLGTQVLDLYGAIYSRCSAASSKDLRRLHGLLKPTT